MKKLTLLITLLSIIDLAYAQTSVFSDGKGESAYKLFGNAVTVNTKDESLALASNILTAHSSDNTYFTRWGLNLKLSAKDGLANLKTDNGFLIAGSIGGFRGWKHTSDPAKPGPGWAFENYVSFNLLVERNKLYDLTRSTGQTFDKGNAGWKFAAGKSGYFKNWLYGLEVNFGEATNSKDLKQYTVSNLQAGSTDSIMVFKEQTAYNAALYKGAQFNVHVNADLAYGLNAQKSANTKDEIPPLFLALHFRYETVQLSKPQFNPAIGFYMGNVGKPRSIVAGFNIQETDAFNVLKESNSSFGKRLGLNFTAGYKL